MHVKLRMVKGNLRLSDGSAVTDLPLSSPTYYIGTGGDCQLRCSDRTISTRHCVIKADGEQVAVHDLNSETGTYVNDAKVVGRNVMKSGDLLRVGNLEFEVLIGDRAVVDGNSRWRGMEPATAPRDEKKLDGDITEMLERADEYERESRLANPEKLRFDTSQLKSDEPAEEAAPKPEPEPVKPTKKKPAKLPADKLPPKTPSIQAENSKDAAAEMLGKLFKGRN